MLDCARDYAFCLLSPTGVVVDWSGGAERILGYAAQEILGRHYECLYSAEDRAAGVPARDLDSARAGRESEGEGWRVRKDGGRFWAWAVIAEVRDGDGEPSGFTLAIRDVTERRLAHEALRESERQFRLLVDGVADHALYMLDPNGVVVSWNAGAQRIKGYAAEDVIGQHYSKFFTETDRLAGLPAEDLQAAMSRGHHESEGWRVRKDGSLFWASAVLHAVRENGALVGFAKITRDISERRAALVELQKTQERLFHAQKLEALGQLTGGVAHDFNNLLMVISGQAELLKQRAGPDPALARTAELIGAATARGAALTRQLLSFARRQPLAPAVVDLAELVEGFRDMLAKSLGPTIRLTLELPSGLWPVEVDPNELEVALINLAVNARDAMRDGGTLVVSAANVSAEAGPGEPEGGFVELSVADTGAGIAPDILPRVFDPFFTTKTDGKGTGLGLSQVYGFATQAGGSVSIDSRLGEGSRVTLRLPRAAAVAASSGPDDGRGLSAGDVLVVEDNPEVAEATAGLVALLGYGVERAASGEAALERLQAGAPFGLVLSDVVMGGPMDGVALAQRLRQDWPATPVLLVTGYAKALANVRGEFPVLQKPFSLEQLDRAIAGALQAQADADMDSNIVRLADARRSREPPAPQRPQEGRKRLISRPEPTGTRMLDMPALARTARP